MYRIKRGPQADKRKEKNRHNQPPLLIAFMHTLLSLPGIGPLEVFPGAKDDVVRVDCLHHRGAWLYIVVEPHIATDGASLADADPA
jgi:hypothetical protein